MVHNLAESGMPYFGVARQELDGRWLAVSTIYSAPVELGWFQSAEAPVRLSS